MSGKNRSDVICFGKAANPMNDTVDEGRCIWAVVSYRTMPVQHWIFKPGTPGFLKLL